MSRTPRSVRLGVVVPSVNTVVEPWFSAVAPPGVTVHAARMFLDDVLSPEAVIAMDRDEGLRAVRQLASVRPAAIAYCCTASSVVQGHAYDARLRAEIEEVGGASGVTSTSSMLTALETLGVKSATIVSPYTDEIDAAERAYFSAAGVEIASTGNLGITDSFRLAEPTPEAIYDLAMRSWDRRADVLLITCLNLRSHTVIQALEREIGVPVVTSTQATLWCLLRTAGVTDAIEGFGTLLSAR